MNDEVKGPWWAWVLGAIVVALAYGWYQYREEKPSARPAPPTKTADTREEATRSAVAFIWENAPKRWQARDACNEALECTDYADYGEFEQPNEPDGTERCLQRWVPRCEAAIAAVPVAPTPIREDYALWALGAPRVQLEMSQLALRAIGSFGSPTIRKRPKGSMDSGDFWLGWIKAKVPDASEHVEKAYELETSAPIQGSQALMGWLTERGACWEGHNCYPTKIESGRFVADAFAGVVRERTEIEEMSSVLSVTSAVRTTQHRMRDMVNAWSEGGLSLAVWAADNLRWEDFEDLRKTTYPRVSKDSGPERGRVLCVQGEVVQIQAEFLGGTKVHEGTFFTRRGDPLVYVAVGSTGDLVADSKARLCGIVIGNMTYSNAMGGMTRAVQLVGMFDLPENR